MDQYTRRIIGFAVHAGNVDGPAVCRMFKEATSMQDWPKYLSSDNDTLFQYHQWKANLRVLEIDEIKSLPHVPLSHPFVERLIGSIRRELLDQTLFWTATDQEKKLREYQCYYNKCRTHSGRDAGTPVEATNRKVVDSYYLWNAVVAWRSTDEHWRVAVEGKNLSDEREIVNSYDVGVVATAGYNPPRFWGVSVGYTF